MTDSKHPESVRSEVQIARDALKQAKATGLIRDFAVRAGGRATIYHVDRPTKAYTTSTLDTLAHLRHIEEGRA